MMIYLQLIDTPEEKSKFLQLCETCRGLLFHVAKNILRNDRDAEDAVHETFALISFR